MRYRLVRLITVAACLGSFAAAGCDQMRSEATVQSQMASGGQMVASAPIAHAMQQSKAAAAGGGSPSATSTLAQDYDARTPAVVSPIADREPSRYLIKNATLTIEAPDVRRAASAVIAEAKAAKGYVSDLHETVDALNTRTVNFVVRVPYTEFDSFLQGFDTLGKMVDRQVTAEDVTEEYVDTQSRLHNLRSTEDRLLSHLSKSGRLSDTLLVERELNRVREESEKLTGRLRFLAHRVSYSTFTVAIQETPHAHAITPPETYSPGKVASDAARSLVGFGQGALSLAIWLGCWSVVWLPPAALGGWLWRRSRMRRVA